MMALVDIADANVDARILGPEEANQLLTRYGIRTPRQSTASTIGELAEQAADWSGPMALKAVVPGVSHKSDIGGVALNLSRPATVIEAASQMQAHIPDLEGFVIQDSLVGSAELFIGMIRDPSLGPFILVGVGGVWVELFDDVTVRPAPLTPVIAEEMIRDLKGAAMLDGYRGASPRADISSVVGVLMAVSRLADENPLIDQLDLNPVLLTNEGPFAVDAHVLAIPEPGQLVSRPRDAGTALDRMLRPSSVAVVGASTNPSKPGGRIFSYLIRHGFQGPLYPVNTSGSEVILGHTAFRSIADLPETPDLACIVVPAADVVPVLEECAERGIPSAIVYTSGFAEAGQKGVDLQAEISNVVERGAIRVSGPNTAGIANAHHSMCAAIGMAFEVPEMPKGNIAFLTQSGALGSSLLSRVWEQGAGFSHWISCGNEVDLTISDYLSVLVEDPDTDVIAIFMEGVRDPVTFADACRRARDLRKPILVYKTGATESGRRAVSSHTAALAGADVLYESFLRANHVIRVRDLQALVDSAVALSWQPVPAGNRVAVISASGGICSVAADECTQRGLELPIFSEETVRQIEKVIPSYGRSQNPVDVTAGITTRPTMIPDTVKLVLEEPDIDAVLVMLTTNAGPAAAELARGLSDAMAGSSKPLIVARVGADSLAPEAVAHYMENRLPLLPMPERAVEALSVMVRAGANVNPPGRAS